MPWRVSLWALVQFASRMDYQRGQGHPRVLAMAAHSPCSSYGTIGPIEYMKSLCRAWGQALVWIANYIKYYLYLHKHCPSILIPPCRCTPRQALSITADTIEVCCCCCCQLLGAVASCLVLLLIRTVQEITDIVTST